MATIVTHVDKGGRFLLVGASYSHWKSARANRLLGDLFPVEDEGQDRVLVVCGADGIVQFGHAEKFRVLEVDGRPVADALRPPA